MILEFKVPFSEGLHTRPAADLVKICQKAASEIKMKKAEVSVNPKSILGIISLGAGYDETVEFEITGSDEAEVAIKLKNFFVGI